QCYTIAPIVTPRASACYFNRVYWHHQQVEAMPMFIERAGNSLRTIPGCFAVQPTSLQALFSKLAAESLTAVLTPIPDRDVATSFQSHYIYTAEAITPVTIRRLSRKSFENEIAVSPDLGPAVFHQMSDEMAAAQDQMVLLSTKNAEERLCSFLLKELQRTLN